MVAVDVPQPSAKQKIVEDDGRPTVPFYRWIVTMWERSGGGGDISGGALQSIANLSDVGSVSASLVNLGFADPVLDKSAPGSIGATTPGTGGFSTLTATGSFTTDVSGNVTAGGGALGTSATDGFLYLPTVSGAPTGTPTTKVGFVPMVYDDVNERLYVYNGAWVSAVFA